MAGSVVFFLLADLLRLALLLVNYDKEAIPHHPPEDYYSIETSPSSHNLLPTSVINVANDLGIATCPSPKERFFDGICYQLMTQGPCKSNQLFYKDPESNDRGVCDCENSLDLYSFETDECYQQNVQGPCPDGEWFTLINKPLASPVSSCQPIPDGCAADGYHVLWSPADEEGSGTSLNQEQCWQLGSQGPCSQDETLERFITNFIGCQRMNNYIENKVVRVNNDIEIFDDAMDEEADRRSVALAKLRHCGPGSRRAQNGVCRVAF